MRLGQQREGRASAVSTISITLDPPADEHLAALASRWPGSPSERVRLAIEYAAAHLDEIPAHDTECWPGARHTSLTVDESTNLALHRLVDYLGGPPGGAHRRAVRLALWFAARDTKVAR